MYRGPESIESIVKALREIEAYFTERLSDGYLNKSSEEHIASLQKAFAAQEKIVSKHCELFDLQGESKDFDQRSSEVLEFLAASFGVLAGEDKGSLARC
jgi:hypothetical protein